MKLVCWCLAVVTGLVVVPVVGAQEPPKPGPEHEVKLRQRLRKLSEAQLDDVLRLYRAPLFRKSLRQMDAATTALLLAFSASEADAAELTELAYELSEWEGE